MTKIGDIASIVRSKNAGPFRLTLDVFFETDADYCRVVEAEVMSTSGIMDAYRVDRGDIIGIYEIPELNAVKISIKRPIPAGNPADSDVYGAQQHTPLSNLEVE